MKGEIDRNWYCTLGRDEEKRPYLCSEKCNWYDCREARHRKWPPLKQFREEYGENWDWAVYILLNEKWEIHPIDFALFTPSCPCVCACTPWARPPDDWRPE